MIDIIYSNTMIAPCFLCNVSYRFKSSWLKKQRYHSYKAIASISFKTTFAIAEL